MTETPLETRLRAAYAAVAPDEEANARLRAAVRQAGTDKTGRCAHPRRPLCRRAALAAACAAAFWRPWSAASPSKMTLAAASASGGSTVDGTASAASDNTASAASASTYAAAQWDATVSAAESYNTEQTAQPDFLKNYTSLAALQSDATLVASGTVVGTQTVMHDAGGKTVPYTLCSFKLTAVYKGGAKSGETILYAQYGGVVTAAQAGPGNKNSGTSSTGKGQKIKFSFGVPLSQTGETQLLFASNVTGYQILDLQQAYYMPVGDYHGRLTADTDGVYTQQLPTWEAADATPLRLTVAEVREAFS